jgi:hypothetical protein
VPTEKWLHFPTGYSLKLAIITTFSKFTQTTQKEKNKSYKISILKISIFWQREARSKKCRGLVAE